MVFISIKDHQLHTLEMILMEWKWNYYFIVVYNNYNHNEAIYYVIE